MADYTKNYAKTTWADGDTVSAHKLNNIEGFVEELDLRTKDLKSTKEDKQLGRSGGGGTSDYRQLTNKPVINGVELNGSLTLQDLGIASASDLSALAEIVGDANALLEEV